MTIANFIRRAMFTPNTSEGVVALFTIDKVGWTDPYRFVSFEGELLDTETLRSGVTHQGHEYTYAVASYRRPSDVPGKLDSIPLVLENVEQDLGALATVSVNDLVVTLVHVARTDPETIVETFPDFQVMSCTADLDSRTVALDLSTDVSQNEPTNIIRFTPDQFGALFP